MSNSRHVKKHPKLDIILRFSKGSAGAFFVVLAASLVSTCLTSTLPKIFSFTIDRVLVEDGIPYLKEHLYLLALLIIGIALLNGISIFLYRTYTAKAGETFAKNMRDMLFSHVQRLSMEWHSANQTGDIIQRCTADVETIRNFVVTQVLEVFRTIFLIVVSLVMMFSMNVKLSLVAVAFMPIIVLYSGVFYRLIAKNFTLADEAEGELSTVVQENATGVRVVRAFGREQYEIDRFDEKNEVFAKMWIRLGTISGLYWGVGDLITGFQILFVIVIGAVEAVHGNLSAGDFVAFATYNTTLAWPVRSLGRILSEMSKAGVSFERVNDILESEEEFEELPKEVAKTASEAVSEEQGVTETGSGESPKRRAAKAETGRGSVDITFSHVSFSYEAGKEILRDLNFTIKEGATYGILGGTGSGKSTLVHLLSRLYDVTEGEITLGGRNLKDIPKQELRAKVAMVLQEPFLFSRSIRDNIAAANPDATIEEIRDAARTACIDDAIMSFPDGYDTIVGERGVTLSGGQRQRVAIARMLMQKAPILIFDDSLSAVDTKTDSLIRRALKEKMKDATVIIISHRITTLMEADQILVLNRGGIEECGTHRELIQREGIYHKIYDIQMNQDDRRYFMK